MTPIPAKGASGLYTGLVSHARVKPRKHKLAYKIFMLLIDLDELPGLKLKTLGVGRFNLFGFDPKRFGDGSGRPLKAQIEATLAEAGIAHGGPIRMLAMPQILGRAFNPLTVYFCHDPKGALTGILYEVNNTFGERHSYLIPADDAPVVKQACDKGFYVSPFMDMDLKYAFRVRPPGDQVQVLVDVDDAEGRVLATGFAATRQELTDRNLVRAWLTHPWMTLGVVAAIHWEALFIWLKGEKIRQRPPKPKWAVTVVTPASSRLASRWNDGAARSVALGVWAAIWDASEGADEPDPPCSRCPAATRPWWWPPAASIRSRPRRRRARRSGPRCRTSTSGEAT